MRNVSAIRALLFGVAAVAITVTTGCASNSNQGRPPTEASAAGIRVAEEAGASEIPQAALHLQLAKEQLGRAKKLLAKGQKERAVSLLMRAEADAELAIALSREDAEAMEASAEMERVHELKENNR